MSYTLLQMTKFILAAMDSEEIDSIADTVESQQVVFILQRCYDELATQLDLPANFKLFNLDSTGSSTPVLMTLPTDISMLDWAKYDIKITGATNPNYRDVIYLELNDFVNYVNGLNGLTSSVALMNVVIGSDTLSFMHRTDVDPMYYTTWDDTNFLFDALDTTKEALLDPTKTQCYGEVSRTFTSTDAFTPTLGDNQFPLLLNKALTTAFIELKQVSNEDARKKARDFMVKSQSDKRRAPLSDQYWLDRNPNYGRK